MIARSISPIAEDHVVFAEATEITEAHRLPIQTYRSQESGVRDQIVADVVDLELAGVVAQQHVAGVGAEETAERDKPPIGPDLAQFVAGQNGVVADIVDLVQARRRGTVRGAQDQFGRGARRRRRIRCECEEEAVLVVAGIDVSPDDLTYVIDAGGEGAVGA
jgi:hypothetical protein